MDAYCRQRQNTASTAKLKNKGLICVKRFLKEKNDVQEIKELTEVNDIVWELAHRGIVSDSDLWLQKLKDDVNAYWLARKVVCFIRENGI